MIRELFPHPLFEKIIDEDSGIDNKKIISSIESSVNKGEPTPKISWQCDVITSISNPDVNNRLFREENNLGEIVDGYVSEFGLQIGLLQGNQKLECRECWYNVYREGMWQERHNHYGSFVSAVYFPTHSTIPLDFFTPNSIHQQMDPHHPVINSKFHKPAISVYPEAGKLVIFRSYMEHGVQYQPLPPKYAETRLSIAFNYGIVPK